MKFSSRMNFFRLIGTYFIDLQDRNVFLPISSKKKMPRSNKKLSKLKSTLRNIVSFWNKSKNFVTSIIPNVCQPCFLNKKKKISPCLITSMKLITKYVSGGVSRRRKGEPSSSKVKKLNFYKLTNKTLC